MAFLEIMYVLLPEIKKYLLVIYSLKKVFELKSYLLNKIISDVLIIPNYLFALKKNVIYIIKLKYFFILI